MSGPAAFARADDRRSPAAGTPCARPEAPSRPAASVFASPPTTSNTREPPSPVDAAFENIRGAEKIRHEQIGRLLVELLWGADLLNHAVVHHRDAVADGVGLFLVVRDEDRGQPEPLLQFAQFAADLDAQLGIEVGQGFVEQQQLRLDRDGARQRDALLLPAGELRGAALVEPGQARPVRARPRRAGRSRLRGTRFSSSPNATLRATVMCGHSA